MSNAENTGGLVLAASPAEKKIRNFQCIKETGLNRLPGFGNRSAQDGLLY